MLKDFKFFLLGLLASGSLAMAAPATWTTIGDMTCKYNGLGTFDCNCSETDTSLTCEIKIGECKNASLVIKPAKGVKGILKPYDFTIVCDAPKLKGLNIDLGCYQTGSVKVTCIDVSSIKTRNCDLKLFASGTNVGRIYAEPGLSEAFCPAAKLGYICVGQYIGDVSKAYTPYTEPEPDYNVFIGNIQKIKTRHFTKYNEHWVSQIKALKIGTIRSSSVSHLDVTEKIRTIRAYNMTGHIKVGCIENASGSNIYMRGVIGKILVANIFGCQVRAGIPDLHASLSDYYNVHPALGLIKKLKSASIVDSIIVSKSRIGIPNDCARPYYGTNVEIWENCKLRKLVLK